MNRCSIIVMSVFLYGWMYGAEMQQPKTQEVLAVPTAIVARVAAVVASETRGTSIPATPKRRAGSPAHEYAHTWPRRGGSGARGTTCPLASMDEGLIKL
jgi:hypothetical protein